MPKSYRAVLFDLFGTVALFDPEKLPVFERDGRRSRSTLGRLREVVADVVPDLSFERFHAAMTEVNAELHEIRTTGMREVASAERFRRTLLRAGLSAAPETARAAEALSLAHMDLLAAAIAVPPAHAQLVARVRERYRVGLVSNFDHGPTARRVIETGGVATHFETTVISAEHGWRKPHRKIFLDALAALDVAPDVALFVGDSPHDDVAGARAAGLDVAWVNAAAAALPDGCPRPHYEVRAIPELAELLSA